MRKAELLGTLSLATDAGTGMPEDHGLRAAILAAKVGAIAGADDATRSRAFYLVLLKYSGCTADGDSASAVFGDEIEFGKATHGMDYGNPREMLPAVLRRARAGKGVLRGAAAMMSTMKALLSMREVMYSHCEVAVLLAKRLGFEPEVLDALATHGARWDGSGMTKQKGAAVPLPMRMAHLAIDVEIGHRIDGEQGAVTRVTKLRGKSLDPALVDAFVAAPAEVCAAIEVPSVWTAFLAAEPAPQREVEGDEIDEAIATMATFADLKSTYTRGHSEAVAELAAAAADLAKLPADVVRDLRRAARLHDLGRVAISTGIWDKAAPLTDLEREKIRLHTYIGERVLARAPSLSRVAELACLAHERLDATGYHRRLGAASCPPAARILAAADCYRAMLEPRPHRPAWDPAGAAAELGRMVAEGVLCPDAVAIVLEAAGHAPKKAPRLAGLTDREVEVLRLVARGLTNKEIATELDISTKTAGHHVQHILGKLGVTTRSAAAILAMQHGFLA